ncbi:ABC transporter substrate-binding protein [Halomonas sp. CnH100-B]|uniref:ABC transporter substrate-binding protein n=1 Tax=unclassified Halomonas TaxID=2609666 RepID=UPI000E89C2D2|nr:MULTISPECIES: ABC transporter substrate-binding protein [unclassified Halomonas]MCO7230582.1 ABC transporter substrate-binding protein [Halomonas sp. CnH100-B]MDK9688735.1 ABC transporter substrate-binding protein [Halomonas sp. LC1]HBM29299.1 ABC transporter substrate-binding protein [Halomonas sp.]|tara:strand:+ start:338 stop:1465 length:1128 start_codon:yes stop_codon:yes gene_type:complete
MLLRLSLPFVGALTSLVCASAIAAPITVTDIAGRQITLDAPAERVILGEGRQIYLLGMLEPDAPLAHVVGWREDFSQADPDNYQRYLERFPEMASIPTFGGFKDGTFDVEQAASLNPDLILMNIEAKAATEDAAYDDKLAELDIPIVYVDFREDPIENTIPSMRLIGQLMNDEAAAEEFITFAEAQLARVTEVIEQANPERPRVFVDRAGGYSDECCMSFGPANFGEYVTLAGGTNIADGIIPASFGNLNPEQIIAANPQHVVVTGGSWDAYVPGGDWVGVGPGADQAQAREKLQALTTRTAMTGIDAVETGNVHAIWHQFYNSPYYFVAVQQLAKWFHPELFEDLDPEATLEELHDRFLPIDYQPGYWITLHDE